MPKEKDKIEPTIPALPTPPPAPSLPPGATLADDGVLELDPRKIINVGDFTNRHAGCYFAADGHCVQGPRIRTGYHYVAIPLDLSAVQREGLVVQYRALGYVRVEGVRRQDLPGALVLRMPEGDFQRLREAKALNAERRNAEIKNQGDSEIAKNIAAAEAAAPKEV